jgi:hypothetical protein
MAVPPGATATKFLLRKRTVIVFLLLSPVWTQLRTLCWEQAGIPWGGIRRQGDYPVRVLEKSSFRGPGHCPKSAVLSRAG